MVYCTRCGTRNLDGDRFCSKCGNSLRPDEENSERYQGRPVDSMVGWMERRYLGLPKGGLILAIVIGLIILIGGLNGLLSYYYSAPSFWWASVLVIFGVILLANAFYRMQKRR